MCEKVKPRVEVQVRLDFLAMNPGEEQTSSKLKAQSSRESEPEIVVNIPREVAYYAETEVEPHRQSQIVNRKLPTSRASAFVPASYVAEARQRIEVYRKLAEITDDEGISRLKAELRDRFGPLPSSVEFLLQLAALKVLAAERGISVLESKEEKLMLTRRGDFIMVGGKFPRLTKKEPKARLNEIKRLLQLIH